MEKDKSIEIGKTGGTPSNAIEIGIGAIAKEEGDICIKTKGAELYITNKGEVSINGVKAEGTADAKEIGKIIKGAFINLLGNEKEDEELVRQESK